VLYFHNHEGHQHHLTEPGDENTIRIIATAENYKAAMHYAASGRDVQLCTPLVVRNIENIDSSILYDQIIPVANSLDARVGGWHPMTHTDAISYYLYSTAAYQRDLHKEPGDDELNGALATAVDSFFHAKARKSLWSAIHKHPIFPYLDMYNVNPVWLGAVIGLIGDPRWFIDPAHPNRSSRLKRYFGLDRLRDADIDDPAPSNNTEYRYWCLHMMRYATDMSKDYVDAFRSEGIRVVVAGDCSTIATCELLSLKAVRAELSRFVIYIRLIWMSLLYPDQPFIPEKFFRDDEDILFFSHHMQSLK